MHTGRPDAENQLVIVRSLADACVFDVVFDSVNRAETRIDRDHPDLDVVGVALGGRPIAATVFDGHFKVEGNVRRQRAKNVVGIDDLDRLVVKNVSGRDYALAIAVDPDRPHRF